MSIHVFPKKVQEAFDPFIVDMILLLFQLFLSAFQPLIEVLFCLGLLFEYSFGLFGGTKLSYFSLLIGEAGKGGSELDPMSKIHILPLLFPSPLLASSLVSDRREDLPVLAVRIYGLSAVYLLVRVGKTCFGVRVGGETLDLDDVQAQFVHSF